MAFDNFFKDKKCDICGKQATTIRNYQYRRFFICDCEKCQDIIKEKMEGNNGIDIRKKIEKKGEK